MPRIEATVECLIHDSFRVQQVAGMFDVPLAEKATATFAVDVPGVEESWDIGLVVGPSGSGKSTIARRAFGDAVADPGTWPADRAVIDCFGDAPGREITGLLTSVGFGSPPAWIKPYSVLSGGERFRCDLARALAPWARERSGSETTTGSARRDASDGELALPPVVVFDEFTSVVDRQVAQVGSAAIAKAIRAGRVACRFVAVSCHYDVSEWLEPDWVVDMASRTCQRRRLRRPEIVIELFRCRHALWSLFAPHHYLSGSLSKMARCHVAMWRSAGLLLRHAADHWPPGPLAHQSDRDLARLSRHWAGHARGRSGGRAACVPGSSAQYHCEPPGGDFALSSIGPLAHGARQADWFAPSRVYSRLSRGGRPSGGVV